MATAPPFALPSSPALLNSLVLTQLVQLVRMMTMCSGSVAFALPSSPSFLSSLVMAQLAVYLQMVPNLHYSGFVMMTVTSILCAQTLQTSY